MKIDTSDVKRGTVLQIDGKLWKIIDISHTHTGRGSATYTFKAVNLVEGGNRQFTYKSGTTLEQADVATKNALFLYAAGDSYTFMENDTSEMHELSEDVVGADGQYLKENLDCFVMVFENRVIGIILPQTIEYVIEETVPGVKGNRAQSGKKPATLENGLEVMVPLHIEPGSTVKINTQTGDVG